MAFTIIKQDLDYGIYLNIQHFAASRGLAIKDENYPINEDLFLTKKNTDHHFILHAERDEKIKVEVPPRENIVAFLLITTNSDYNKKDKLTKAINKIGKMEKLIIVKPNTMKINKVPFHTVELVNGNTHLIKNWAQDLADKGRIVSLPNSESWKIMEEIFIVEGKNLPALDPESHEIVWSNFEEGDIVYLETPSLSSNGIQSGYYIIKSQ